MNELYTSEAIAGEILHGTDEWELAYMEQLKRENSGRGSVLMYASRRIATIKARMESA